MACYEDVYPAPTFGPSLVINGQTAQWEGPPVKESDEETSIEVDLSLSVNKNKNFLQVKRIIQNEILITDFYFYQSDVEKKYIIEKWNFEGGTNDESKHLRIPKTFIYPLKKIPFKETVLCVPNEKELICEFLYGRNWDKKLIKDLEYEIKVINGKPYLYMVKKFLFFKRLILTL